MKSKLLPLLLVHLLIYTNIFSQTAGTPDKTFGNKGVAQIRVILSNHDTAADATQIAQLSNGKFIVGVVCPGISHIDGYVYRLNNNGIVDSAFGKNGRVQVYSASNNGSIYFYFNDLLIDSNDNIILSEFIDAPENGSFTIIRLKKDGRYDSSFNENGIKVINKNAFLLLDNAVALRPNGKIIASTSFFYHRVGHPNVDTTIQYQFRNDGSLDPSFNNLGYITSNRFEFSSIGVQPDGKVIYAGNYLEQLNFNGTQNLNFADTGIINMSQYGYVTNIEILPDGKIMCLVHNSANDRNFTQLIKFNKTGKLDSSLNANGKLPIYAGSGGGAVIAGNVIAQPDGKFLLNTINVNNTNSKIRRFLSNGKIDSTFADNGEINTSYKINQIIFQKNLKIVAVQGAHSKKADTSYFYVYRYNNDVENSKLSLSVSEMKIGDKANLSIKIYPNPVKSVLNIQGLTSNTKLSIVNSNEEKLLTAIANSDDCKLNVQNLAAGSYFLIASKNNKIIASLKFIKQ